MAVYTVHVPAAEADRLEAIGRAVYVRESFNWAAFFLGPLWLAFRRCWLGLTGWLALAAGIFLFARAAAPGYLPVLLAFLALQVLLGLEASQLRRWSLRRRGFKFASLIEGRSREEAEIAFAREFETGTALSIAAAPAPVRPRDFAQHEAIGLAPLGGGR